MSSPRWAIALQRVEKWAITCWNAVVFGLMQAALIELTWIELRNREYNSDSSPGSRRGDMTAGHAEFMHRLMEESSAHTDDKVRQLLSVSSVIVTILLAFGRQVEPRWLMGLAAVALLASGCLALAVLGVRKHAQPDRPDAGEADSDERWARQLMGTVEMNQRYHRFRVDQYRAARRWFFVAIAAVTVLTLIGRTAKAGDDGAVAKELAPHGGGDSTSTRVPAPVATELDSTFQRKVRPESVTEVSESVATDSASVASPRKARRDRDDSLLVALLGPTIGALLAFMFYQLSDRLTRHRDRQRKHHTAMVRIERELQEQSASIADNIYLAKPFRGIMSQGHVHWSLPRPILQTDGLDLDLLNLVVINDYFSHRTGIRKINDDTENLRRAYELICELYVGGKFTREAYLANAGRIADGLEQIARAEEVELREMRDFLALVRVLTPKDSTRLRHVIWGPRSAVASLDELASEKAELELDFAKVREASEKRIAEMGQPALGNKSISENEGTRGNT